MTIIPVGCAIIHKNGKLLIAQRKPGTHLGLYWEFPGGKIENGESIEACLRREVREELGIAVQPSKLVLETDHPYPDRIIRLYFYLCDWVSGEPQCLDCEDFRWIHPEELRDFQFPPADTEMIRDLIKRKEEYFGKHGA